MADFHKEYIFRVKPIEYLNACSNLELYEVLNLLQHPHFQERIKDVVFTETCELIVSKIETTDEN